MLFLTLDIMHLFSLAALMLLMAFLVYILQKMFLDLSNFGNGLFFGGHYEYITEMSESGMLSLEDFRFYVGQIEWNEENLLEEINEGKWWQAISAYLNFIATLVTTCGAKNLSGKPYVWIIWRMAGSFTKLDQSGILFSSFSLQFKSTK